MTRARCIDGPAHLACLSVMAGAALWLLSGCGSLSPGGINADYGARRSARGAGSVNGVGVLADMFERQGHQVSSWKRLSPKLREADVIVWAPDDFSPPSEEQRKFLEQWVFEEDTRTLVYIGRDFDASIGYWKHVATTAPPEQAQEVARRLASARANHDSARAEIPDQHDSAWFVIDTGKPKRRIKNLQGPWIAELNGDQSAIDGSKLEIELDARLKVPVSAKLVDGSGKFLFEKLLTSGPDVLVSRLAHSRAGQWATVDDEGNIVKEEEESAVDDGGDEFDDLEFEEFYVDGYEYESEDYGFGHESRWIGDGQIIVVANGSFLLNLPLVNRQHRILASKLIETCDPFDQSLNVVFLESGVGGPIIYDKEPKMRTGLEALTVWPLNVILLHMLALGILFCFIFFPILGRPIDRKLVRVVDGQPIYADIGSESTGPSDFGAHIDAHGELMNRTGDAGYAQQRLSHYQQHVKRDSGASHKAAARKTAAPPTTAKKPPTN